MAITIPEGVKSQVKKIVSEELLRLAADKGPGLLEKGAQGIAKISKKRKGEAPEEVKEPSLHAVVTLLKEIQDEQEQEIEDLKEALDEKEKSILALESAVEGLSRRVRILQYIAIAAVGIAALALIIGLR